MTAPKASSQLEVAKPIVRLLIAAAVRKAVATITNAQIAGTDSRWSMTEMTSRVVPREPTQAMIDAWHAADQRLYGRSFADYVPAIWQAMFDAAPTHEPVPDAERVAQQNAELQETAQQLFRLAQEQQRRAETAEQLLAEIDTKRKKD